MIRSHFAEGVTEQGDMQKAVSNGWRKESSPSINIVGRCLDKINLRPYSKHKASD